MLRRCPPTVFGYSPGTKSGSSVTIRWWRGALCSAAGAATRAHGLLPETGHAFRPLDAAVAGAAAGPRWGQRNARAPEGGRTGVGCVSRVVRDPLKTRGEPVVSAPHASRADRPARSRGPGRTGDRRFCLPMMRVRLPLSCAVFLCHVLYALLFTPHCVARPPPPSPVHSTQLSTAPPPPPEEDQPCRRQPC